MNAPKDSPSNNELLALIKRAGLTDSQAKGYLALVEHGELTPSALSDTIDETRTNGYAITERLEQLGLATKTENRKVTYRAAHPSALELLAERRRKVMTVHEQAIKQQLPQLVQHYYAHNETPGVRYLNSREGLAEIYEDILRTNRPLMIVRTPGEKKFFGKDMIRSFINRRIEKGIPLDALTPYTDAANKDPSVDARELLTRTFFPEDRYTAPVEIEVYGSKVGFLSFGEDLAGVIIDNPHIADAMRQLLELAKMGAQTAFSERTDLVDDLKRARNEGSS